MDIAYAYGTGTMTIPMGTPTLPASSVKLAAYRLTVYDWADTGTLAINGNSTLLYGSCLTTQGQGTGGLPPAPLANNGVMRLQDSTLQIGAIKGTGQIVADRSMVRATSATTSETINVHSSQLDIGYGSHAADPGMQFLAPVTGFDDSSRITLENTHATLEVYFRASGALFLFDGVQMVANMHVSGSPTIYASQITPVAGAPSVLLSSTNLGVHGIPATVI